MSSLLSEVYTSSTYSSNCSWVFGHSSYTSVISLIKRIAQSSFGSSYNLAASVEGVSPVLIEYCSKRVEYLSKSGLALIFLKIFLTNRYLNASSSSTPSPMYTLGK